MRLPVATQEFKDALADDDIKALERMLASGHPALCRATIYIHSLPAICQVGSKKTMELLIDYGAEATWKELHMAISCNMRNSADVVQWLIDVGVPVDGKPQRLLGNEHRQPLVSAISSLNIDAFRVLIANGANPVFRDKLEGLQPLHFLAHDWAIRNNGDPSGVWETRVRDVYVKMIDTLIERGAMIDAVDLYGWTPLVYSIKWNGKETTAYFVKLGADLFKQDHEGREPWTWARSKGARKVLKGLLKEKEIIDFETGEYVRRVDQST